jgi:hypothetical protein
VAVIAYEIYQVVKKTREIWDKVENTINAIRALSGVVKCRLNGNIVTGPDVTFPAITFKRDLLEEDGWIDIENWETHPNGALANHSAVVIPELLEVAKRVAKQNKKAKVIDVLNDRKKRHIPYRFCPFQAAWKKSENGRCLCSATHTKKNTCPQIREIVKHKTGADVDDYKSAICHPIVCAKRQSKLPVFRAILNITFETFADDTAVEFRRRVRDALDVQSNGTRVYVINIEPYSKDDRYTVVDVQYRLPTAKPPHPVPAAAVPDTPNGNSTSQPSNTTTDDNINVTVGVVVRDPASVTSNNDTGRIRDIIMNNLVANQGIIAIVNPGEDIPKDKPAALGTWPIVGIVAGALLLIGIVVLGVLIKRGVFASNLTADSSEVPYTRT